MISCKKGSVSKENLVEKLGNEINEIESYQVTGVMTIDNEDVVSEYDLDVSYKKEDNYKVSLTNRKNNTEQIILKNEEGVYVLTPSLNKSFKFQSDWPINSNHSYLYELVLGDIINDQNKIITEDDELFYIESSLQDKMNNKYSKQVVEINKETLKPKRVSLINDNGEVGLKVEFNGFEVNKEFGEDYFNEEYTLNTSILKLGDGFVSNEDPIFKIPTNIPENTILDEISTDENSKIMQYKGDYNFTVYMDIVDIYEGPNVIRVYNDPIEIKDMIGAKGDNFIKWFDDGVSYTIYSNDMTMTELIEIANSFDAVTES